MKLMNHLYMVAGVSLSHSFDATAYLIEGDAGLYLLDCGTPDGFFRITENIRLLGFAPDDIRYIYGTHGHYYHVGAAAIFQQKYKCRVMIHEADAWQVETGDPILTTGELLYGNPFPPCIVNGYLKDGQQINFGNQITMTVVHTPGHTRGSVCFALDCAGYQFLVAGDTIWGGFSEQIGSDAKLWMESLDKLTAMHFDGFSFGHVGANVIADADRRIMDAKRQFGVYYNPWFKPMKEEFRY
ncbi:MBL fold metallo-hydrolase [Robinsoniella peoriensis]|uniref:Metallo-beta-lactamase L1 n=1 Tax=Robinsoniella peoriensis TaxID=180332 RepID=A0A4U8Q0B1_9FIRM|nr:MBL fold metallo-hydrolase [Robinsoniella peoriensis]MDU7028736.1 MBL fold metallo-hydrolase [Clostridiales bacterium]TLC98104.1 Metallo-beta-lactamase L1 precursor [Robinsoniella peoriensis]